MVRLQQNEKNITLISAYLVRNLPLTVTTIAMVFSLFLCYGLWISQYIEHEIQCN